VPTPTRSLAQCSVPPLPFPDPGSLARYQAGLPRPLPIPPACRRRVRPVHARRSEEGWLHSSLFTAARGLPHLPPTPLLTRALPPPTHRDRSIIARRHAGVPHVARPAAHLTQRCRVAYRHQLPPSQQCGLRAIDYPEPAASRVGVSHTASYPAARRVRRRLLLTCDEGAACSAHLLYYLQPLVSLHGAEPAHLARHRAGLPCTALSRRRRPMV
jgi:hypothetical protein